MVSSTYHKSDQTFPIFRVQRWKTLEGLGTRPIMPKAMPAYCACPYMTVVRKLDLVLTVWWLQATITTLHVKHIHTLLQRSNTKPWRGMVVLYGSMDFIIIPQFHNYHRIQLCNHEQQLLILRPSLILSFKNPLGPILHYLFCLN